MSLYWLVVEAGTLPARVIVSWLFESRQPLEREAVGVLISQMSTVESKLSSLLRGEFMI